MRQQMYAPALCLLFLLSLFNCTFVVAKEEDKVKTATHISFTASTNNFAATADNSNLNSTSVDVHETATNVQDATSKTYFIKGLFYGSLAIMLLISIASFFIFEEKVFGFFGLTLSGSLALFFSEDSIGFLLFGNMIENTNALTTTLSCIAAGLIAAFSSKYLTLKEYYPKLKTFTLPLFAFALGLSIATWFVPGELLSITANIMSFAIIFIYYGVGVSLFSKNNYSKFYVIGFSIPLLFSLDYFLLSGLGINFLNTELYHVKTAYFINILLMTYAIVYRMKAIKEETVLRKTEMQIFLKRQEMMNRDNIAKMVEDVYLENLIMHYDLDGLEIKLLQYISEGKENKKIARKLNTTEVDVEEMTRDLYHKLQISDAIQEDVNLLDAQPDYIYN